MGHQRTTSFPSAVLVVEDEFLIALEVVGVLEDAGYEVIGPAPTVAIALEFLERHSVQACFLDVNLRGQHSAAVASALKDRSVPFVLSSAYEQATLEQHAAFEGVENLGKPVSRERLLSAISSFLNR